MKERPIIFSAPMVRALLAGTKTQTRRIAKPVKHPDLGNVYSPGALVLEHEPQHVIDRACPYGKPGGDRLYVREAWAAPHAYDHLPPRLIPQDARIHYAATEDRGGLLWRPSIHMPRWASRITLEVTGVRVERLQGISEADAIAEGARNSLHLPGGRFARENFEHLWWTINGDGSWESNPWVWVVEFKAIEAKP